MTDEETEVRKGAHLIKITQAQTVEPKDADSGPLALS